MRPFPCQISHQVHKLCPCRQHIRRGAAAYRFESRLSSTEPCPSLIKITRKIRHEEQVKMAQMIGNIFCGKCQVGCQTAIFRGLQTHRMRQCLRRCRRLRHRTNTTNPRHEHECIQRMLVLEYLLETPVHRRVNISSLNPAIGDIQRNFQIAFHPIEWANH